MTWGSTEFPSPAKSPELSATAPWLTAAEFQDTPDTADVKTDVLIQLLHCARHAVVYTGCGVSTSAGIRQEARGSDPANNDKYFYKTTEAVPSVSHLALASLFKVIPLLLHSFLHY